MLEITHVEKCYTFLNPKHEVIVEHYVPCPLVENPPQETLALTVHATWKGTEITLPYPMEGSK
jgi:hypothetical protein